MSSTEAQRLGQLLAPLFDPVRVRILFALVGLVLSRQDGRVIDYHLAAGLPHQLLEHCLNKLFTISAKEAN